MPNEKPKEETAPAEAPKEKEAAEQPKEADAATAEEKGVDV